MSRFLTPGGSIIDRVAGDRDLSLLELEALAGIWSRKALAFETEGRMRLARLCARDAADAYGAALKVSAWRRAAGHRNPHDADNLRRASA